MLDADINMLKDNLIEELHYSLLPKAAWKKLVLWHGLSPGSKPICRYVYIIE